jgi:hypothetical protein
MLSHPNGKSIMTDARLHPVNEPKKSHQTLLCNVLGIIVITEETAANREHQLTERGGNMFKLFLRHLLYKRKSERKVKLKNEIVFVSVSENLEVVAVVAGTDTVLKTKLF